MRSVVVAAGGVLLSAGLGCALLAGAGSSREPAADSTSTPPSALARRVGQVLELSVPLLGGGVQPLAELRGRPVLLELADAASPQRDAAQDRYRALAEREAEALTVVSVALDADTTALPASWTDDRPPFVLGWDPQGAVAARLQLSALPTVILLDAQGVIVEVHEGAPPDDQALERWLRDAADGGP